MRHLIKTIEHYSRIYFCKVAAFSIPGSHYHLVVKFEEERPVSRKVLREKTRLMYPSKAGQEEIDKWSDEQWEHYRKRLFDVSQISTMSLVFLAEGYEGCPRSCATDTFRKPRVPHWCACILRRNIRPSAHFIRQNRPSWVHHLRQLRTENFEAVISFLPHDQAPARFFRERPSGRLREGAFRASNVLSSFHGREFAALCVRVPQS